MGSKPVGISASRASAIIGLNSFQSPFEVWQRIMEERRPGFNAERGYIMPDEPDNASIRWGNAFESAVIALAENAYLGSGKIIDMERFYSVSMGDFEITCHIDGRYSDYMVQQEDRSFGPLLTGPLHEGKTTSYFSWKEKWGDPGTDKIPQEYQVQVQHQMICTGADEVIVSVLVFPKRVEEFEEDGVTPELVDEDVVTGEGIYMLVGNFGGLRPKEWAKTLDQMGYFHQYPVKANPELQARLKQLYAEWWERHVINEEPPTEGMTYDDVRRMIPEPVGTIVIDPKTARLFKEYKDITNELGTKGSLPRRKKQIQVDLINRLSKYKSFKDDESEKKWVFRSETGEKLGQYDGKTFRVQ